MKVVGLISGGKDSLFNLMECVKHGHEVIALANLYPAASAATEGGKSEEDLPEELDSFMFQTVGHSTIAAMAACMGLPLIRIQTQGKSVHRDMSYPSSAQVAQGSHDTRDEVEDLFFLLQAVKERFPGVQGVACGAILSSYQRHRVEAVCQRLNLTPLSFLWQREQKGLLEEMIASGVEAVLLKVASLGLTADMLGKTLAELKPAFYEIHKDYGLNVCGEGGEYESLVLDCPLFTQGRLRIENSAVEKEEGGVAHLIVKKCSIVPKQDGGGSSAASGAAPALGAAAGTVSAAAAAAAAAMEVPSAEIILVKAPSSSFSSSSAAADGTGAPEVGLPAAQAEPLTSTASAAALAGGKGSASAPATSSPAPAVAIRGGMFHTSLLSVSAPAPSSSSSAASPAPSPKDQAAADTEATLLALEQLLQQHGISIKQQTCFVHLYLSDMSHFEAVNAAYCRHFPAVNPPSRSCVQAAFPLHSAGTGRATAPAAAAGEGSQASLAPSNSPWVALDCIGVTSETSRRDILAAGRDGVTAALHLRSALHVQSRSAWAPLCIGPYCQANVLHSRGLLLPAGQIGLDPASMELTAQPAVAAGGPGGSSVDPYVAHLTALTKQLSRSLLNAAHVLSCTGSSLTRCMTFKAYISSAALQPPQGAAAAETSDSSTVSASASAAAVAWQEGILSFVKAEACRWLLGLTGTASCKEWLLAAATGNGIKGRAATLELRACITAAGLKPSTVEEEDEGYSTEDFLPSNYGEEGSESDYSLYDRAREKKEKENEALAEDMRRAGDGCQESLFSMGETAHHPPGYLGLPAVRAVFQQLIKRVPRLASLKEKRKAGGKKEVEVDAKVGMVADGRQEGGGAAASSAAGSAALTAAAVQQMLIQALPSPLEQTLHAAVASALTSSALDELPLLLVVMPKLPRNAMVEVEALAHDPKWRRGQQLHQDKKKELVAAAGDSAETFFSAPAPGEHFLTEASKWLCSSSRGVDAAAAAADLLIPFSQKVHVHWPSCTGSILHSCRVELTPSSSAVAGAAGAVEPPSMQRLIEAAAQHAAQQIQASCKYIQAKQAEQAEKGAPLLQPLHCRAYVHIPAHSLGLQKREVEWADQVHAEEAVRGKLLKALTAIAAAATGGDATGGAAAAVHVQLPAISVVPVAGEVNVDGAGGGEAASAGLSLEVLLG